MSRNNNVSPIQALRERYHRGASPLAELARILPRSNSNASHNVYLAQNTAWTQAEAAKLPPGVHHDLPLAGIPISLKDCFDLAGFPTSCGSKFYLERNGIATEDSAIAARLRSRGALITGKTHLHQLAYGITGENADFGDCLQPLDPVRLTGGSSSGAAASVQEGSAIAAIGTDTGGSIRTPAALCGLAGFRASIATGAGLWQGGAHLAPTFDTLGFLYDDLRDGPFLAHHIFNLAPAPPPVMEGLRIGIPNQKFLHDCDPEVLHSMDAWIDWLTQQGAHILRFDTAFWHDAFDIFAPLQAGEAAAIHRGNFEHFEPAIAQRLAWGAAFSPQELTKLRTRMDVFVAKMDDLFHHMQAILMPATPVLTLHANADNSPARARILRYTTPVSLAGLPAITMPPIIEGSIIGLQLAMPRGKDAQLLALTHGIAQVAAI